MVTQAVFDDFETNTIHPDIRYSKIINETIRSVITYRKFRMSMPLCIY